MHVGERRFIANFFFCNEFSADIMIACGLTDRLVPGDDLHGQERPIHRAHGEHLVLARFLLKAHGAEQVNRVPIRQDFTPFQLFRPIDNKISRIVL